MAYKLFDISTPDDLDRVADYIEDTYNPQCVMDELKVGLDPCCKNVLLETDYNDKDYRSAYYHYYAKKGYRYGTSCVRLHFFDARAELDANSLELRFNIDPSRDRPSETYFGYMVLRPTRQNTIGRTVISARAIAGFHGSIIEANHKIHLLGHRLVVAGFPWMSQHTDIAVCAHVACWSILRHYSERFSKYAEFLTHDITRMAHEFDPGGLLPSAGLHVGHAERVFATAGTYPILIFKQGIDPALFYRQLFAYIESGFPLFALLERIGHAVTVMGHTGFTGSLSQSAPCHFAFDFVTDLVVVDDNYLPYRAIPRAVGTGLDYGCEDISAFIVPLPDKIYYPAENADTLAMVLATEVHLGFDHTDLGEPVVRYFLTTAAHLRWFMHENRSQFDPQLVSLVMELSMPQFVWVIEIASIEQWKNGTVTTRAVIDATASPAEELPIFLMHNTQRAYLWDRGGDHQEKYVTLSSPPDTRLSRIDGKYGNLEPH
jgi:hypothetical protein